MQNRQIRRTLNTDDWNVLERFISEQPNEFGQPLTPLRKAQLIEYFKDLIENQDDGFLLGSFADSELKCLISFYFFESFQTGFVAHIFSRNPSHEEMGLTMDAVLKNLENYDTRSYLSVMLPQNVERFQKYWERHTPSIRGWPRSRTETILAGQKPEEARAWEAMGRQVWEHDLVLVAREHISS